MTLKWSCLFYLFACYWNSNDGTIVIYTTTCQVLKRSISLKKNLGIFFCLDKALTFLFAFQTDVSPTFDYNLFSFL